MLVYLRLAVGKSPVRDDFLDDAVVGELEK
jgi:hypothetical protein